MPRLPLPVEQEATSGTKQGPLPDLTEINELNINDYLVPTPESDWLGEANTVWRRIRSTPSQQYEAASLAVTTRWLDRKLDSETKLG